MFQDSLSTLGDSMNFPESSSVKKREALSNIIFKITQSTENLNKRNERLLKLNLNYELKMLRLAKQKEKWTWEKLNCEKLCSSQTKSWLFKNDYKFGDRYDGKALRNTVTSLPALTMDNGRNELIGKKENGSVPIRRICTAPVGKINRHEIGRKTRSMTEKDIGENYSADDQKTDMSLPRNALSGIKNNKTNDAHGALLPDLYKKERTKKNLQGKQVKKVSHFAGNEKQNEHLCSQDCRDGRCFEEDEEINMNSFGNLMKKAEKSTEQLSAFVPLDPDYRRTCATRKAYKDMEMNRPRILTRYFREKRTFGSLRKNDKREDLFS